MIIQQYQDLPILGNPHVLRLGLLKFLLVYPSHLVQSNVSRLGLINLLQESSVFYKFSPEKGNTNWLYIDSFITENQRKEESIILGITEKGENTNNYAPSSILRGIPDEKGDYIGNVLIIACRNFSLKKEKYKAIYKVTDVSKIPDELKKDILDLENYNCITGNPIGNIKFKNFENRWIAKIDLERYGIEKKEIDIEGTQISAGFIEEERIYAGVMIYYNIWFRKFIINYKLESEIIAE